MAELIDSDEISRAVGALLETYFLYIGTRHLGWLLYAYEQFKDEDINVDALFVATVALCRIKERDHSLVALHLWRMVDEGPPDWPTASAEGANPLESFFAACVRQGKVRAAFWAVGGLDEGAIGRGIEVALAVRTPVSRQIFEIVKSVRRWGCVPFAWHTMVALCLMYVGLRAVPIVPIVQTMPTWLADERSAWDAVLGQRGRRLYAPRQDCYYLETRRGCMTYKESNESVIRQLGTDPVVTMSLLGPWATDAPPPDDDAWDAWATRLFVDDIPDEWSTADVAKSHGAGQVGGLCAPTLEKWLRRFNFAGAYYSYGMKPATSTATEITEPWSATTWLESLWRPGLDAAAYDLAPRRVEYVIPAAS
jgi:hypothetical protein